MLRVHALCGTPMVDAHQARGIVATLPPRVQVLCEVQQVLCVIQVLCGCLLGACVSFIFDF